MPHRIIFYSLVLWLSNKQSMRFKSPCRNLTPLTNYFDLIHTWSNLHVVSFSSDHLLTHYDSWYATSWFNIHRLYWPILWNYPMSHDVTVSVGIHSPSVIMWLLLVVNYWKMSSIDGGLNKRNRIYVRPIDVHICM